MMWARCIALGFGASVIGVLAGCPAPCGNDSECASDQFCSDEKLCVRECTINQDCDNDRQCNLRGKCTISLEPRVTIVSPTPSTRVDGRYDVEVEIVFRSDLATVVLERVPTLETETYCLPFSPREIIVTGDIRQEVTQRVVFQDLEPLGQDFGFQASVTANQLTSTARTTLRGPPAAGIGGASISSPSEQVVRTNSLSTVLAATLTPPATVVSAWVEPERGAPSPRVLLGQNVSTIDDVAIPLARGRQTVWVETEREGATSRCGVGVDVSPVVPSTGLEIALTFESTSEAELDLWIYAEREGYGPEQCNSDFPRNLCRDVQQSVPFRTSGEELLSLALDPGVYGIAVAPRIVGEPVSARLRLSIGGTHLMWLGPRRIFADEGRVWLAGRVYVLDGAVTVESLEDMVVGLPEGTVSDW